MSIRIRRSALAVLLVTMMVASALPGLMGSPGGDDHTEGDRGPLDVSPWVDDFDDSSKVSITQNTVVTGGQVELSPGQPTGLVASVAIAPPPGYRYDSFIMRVDTPGGSSVKGSVLNATQPSTHVGYVNEPIPGFMKRDETHIPLTGVGTATTKNVRPSRSAAVEL